MGGLKPETDILRDDVFSSKTSLDTMFQTLSAASTKSTDVLLVGFEDGTIHLSIYDFFQVGIFNLHQAFRQSMKCEPLLHSSHPCSTTHSLLVAASSHLITELYLVPLDLRLISSIGQYLPLLASKSTQLQNVLRYMSQVQQQIYTEFRGAQDLPTRFIQNIEETLRENNSDCTLVQALYHLAVTGDCFPPIKEWLVDELGERVGL